MPYPVYPADLFLTVDEIPGRTGRPYSVDGKIEYVRKWRVRTTLKGLGGLVVCTAPGIPRPGAPYISSVDGVYEYDLNALLTDLRYQENTTNDDWGDYEVTATYGNRFPTGGPANLAGAPGSQAVRDNPTLEWPTIRWTFQDLQIPRYQDLDGLTVTNSAGQLSNGGAYTRKFGCKVLTVTRNEATFDSDKAQRYAYAVNSQPFLGYPRWAVQCLPPQAEARFNATMQYWTVTYTLHFHPKNIYNRADLGGMSVHPRTGASRAADLDAYLNTWQVLQLDAGTRQYTGPVVKGAMALSVINTQQIFQDGRPIHDPVLLNGKGKQLSEDDDPNMRPVYCGFRMYPEYDFTTIAERGFS